MKYIQLLSLLSLFALVYSHVNEHVNNLDDLGDSIVAFNKHENENDIEFESESEQIIHPGMLILFQSKNEPKTKFDRQKLDNHFNELMNFYKIYITDILQNKIKYTYDTIFNGYSIEFNNLDQIFKVLEQSEGISSKEYLTENNELKLNPIIDGLTKALIDYKKEYLDEWDIELITSPDELVSIDD